jgi:hypothetical protein
MFKLGHFIDNEWREHSHPPVFDLLPTDAGAEKIITTAPGGDPLIFRSLMRGLSDPLNLLYVLHTPRGEAEPGRYQSPEITFEAAASFIARFALFLQADARFDLWVHSPDDEATIVWDRHNLIYVYGVSTLAAESLRSLGFHQGSPAIPVLHEHYYHPALDGDAKALISYFDWRFSPLQPADEQS